MLLFNIVDAPINPETLLSLHIKNSVDQPKNKQLGKSIKIRKNFKYTSLQQTIYVHALKAVESDFKLWKYSIVLNGWNIIA